MNVFDSIQSARPDVTPMPMAKRRMIRESLFGLGHGDSTSNISSRSESGAVVSTAPHGTRRPIQRRPRASGSIAKLSAGLLLFGALGTAVWSYSQRDEAIDSTAATTTVVAADPVTTPLPTTIAPPLVRTGVTASEPLVLPPTLLTVDDLVVAPPGPGSSSAMLGAPDGTLVWLAEFDGEAADPSGLDVRQIGSIGVGVDANRLEGANASYRLLVPCGFVIVNDAPGLPLDRPALTALFNASSIDADATLDISLPPDWSVFSIGDNQITYTAQFQVAISDETRSLRLAQVPNGSYAQLAFGGRQLQPTTFLGGPAFIDTGALDPNLVSVFWKDTDTVFNASSPELSLSEIEAFIEAMEPASLDAWNRRFGTERPDLSSEAPACTPQPNLGSTLDP